MTAVLLFAALSAADLQARFLETRLPSDKQAWYAACEREGIDVTKRVRSAPDERGIVKFNRDSRLVQIVLGKKAAQEGDWTEDLGEDGVLHVSWTRKANGAVVCSYSAPTNWSVFVNTYKGHVTRYGVKLMKEQTGRHPSPTFSLPDGWRVVEGEEYTGVNVREVDGAWRHVGEYRIEDDPEKGVMTAPGETILYDPDTSRRRKEEEKK